jgi:hypothetical protein
MNIYCLEDFKVEFEKLNSKKSYNNLEQDIIDYFFDKSTIELSAGVRLNNSEDNPYVKKRLNGRGGFRLYFLLIIKQENLYLMFVHPKTGSEGSENITDESKAFLYKKVLNCIKSNDLYHLSLNDNKDTLIFKRTEVV